LEGRAKSKSKTVFESQVSFFVCLKKQIRFYGLVIFFSGGFGRLFFLVHFVSGFQIVGFSNLVLSFQFWFWRWSKFWLIVACNYLASLLVKSVWRRFFSSAIFLVGFAGFLNRLNFVSKVSGLVKSGFQNWLGCRVYRDMISSEKIRANFILVLGCRACRDIGQVFLQRFWLVVFGSC
jgi:hypothetical protein